MLPIISGPDTDDPAVVEKPFGDPATVSLNSLRVAFHTFNGVTKAAKIVQTVRAVAKVLSGTSRTNGVEGIRILSVPPRRGQN